MKKNRIIINFAQFFRFEQLREDKADVVAFLKRALQQRTDQISELQARLEGLQHVHETDGQAYEKKIADMKAEVSLFTFEFVYINQQLFVYNFSWKKQGINWDLKTWC